MREPAPQLSVQQFDELRRKLEAAEAALRTFGRGAVGFEAGFQVEPGASESAEPRYATLVQGLNAGILTLLPDGTITYANPSCVASLRMPPERLVGARLSDFINAAERPLLERMLEAGVAERHEFHLLAGDGRRVPVLLSLGPLPNDRQGRLGALLTDLSDVLQLQQTLRHIVDNAPNLTVIAWDAQSTRMLATGRGLNALGLAPTELLGSSAPLPLPLLPGGAERRRRVQAGEDVRASVEIRGRTLDLWSSPLRNEQGAVIGGASVAVDVTERARVERELFERVQQQAAVAAFGQRALAEMEVPALIDDAVQTVARTLGVDFCKIVELQPDGQHFVVRSVVGADMDLDRLRPLSAMPHSRDTLSTPGGIMVEDYATSIYAPDLNQRVFEAASGLSVAIPSKSGRPFGVLVAQSRQQRAFSPDDFNFFRAIAHTLAQAIDHLQAGEAVRQSEAYYRTLIGNVSDVIAVVNRQGILRFMGGAVERTFGYVPDEMYGFQVLHQTHPDDLPRVLADLERAFALGAQFTPTTECRIRTKSGAWRNFEIRRANAILAGEPVMVSTLHDVTERQELDRERALMAAVVASSSDAIVSRDLERRIVSWNPAAERLFGLKAEEVLGRVDFYLKGDSPSHAEELDLVMITGQPREIDARRIRPDGTVLELGGTSAPMRDSSGRFIGITSTLRDVGERKRVDRERALLASVVASSDDAIISRDLAWRLTSWNPGAARLFGYQAAEVLGRLDDFLDLPENRARIRTIFEQVVREGHAQEFEILRVRRDGTLIDLAMSVSPLYDSAGQVAGVTSICRDTTLHQLAERARELADANAELEQFAYVASHDLKEPLRTIDGYTHWLKRHLGGQIDSRVAECLGYIQDGARRMQELIDALLEYARVTPPAALVPVDCNAVVTSVLQNLHGLLAETGGQVNCSPLPTVRGDERLVTQVFQNLIGNGLKFHSLEAPVIEVSAVRELGHWRFAVRDNGIGIAAADRDRVFKMFERLHGRREYPGTGIGLTLCRRAVERLGGRIWVESEVGQGATFCFTLPAGPG